MQDYIVNSGSFGILSPAVPVHTSIFINLQNTPVCNVVIVDIKAVLHFAYINAKAN